MRLLVRQIVVLDVQITGQDLQNGITFGRLNELSRVICLNYTMRLVLVIIAIVFRVQLVDTKKYLEFRLHKQFHPFTCAM